VGGDQVDVRGAHFRKSRSSGIDASADGRSALGGRGSVVNAGIGGSVLALMRILIRTSRWAVWARRFGALALPLAVLPVLLHRGHVITSDNFVAVEAVALILAALGLLMAIVAYVRLWFTGDQGWWKATMALLLSLACLAPAAYFGWEDLHNTEAADVTTDFANPPDLVSAAPPHVVSAAERAHLEAAFPNARSRNYPIAAPQMYDVVNGLVMARGWDVRFRRQPASEFDTGAINAIVTTPLGFQQEVAIRVAGGADGTTIAMRSASLSVFPDFGENGQRIEDLMLDLDTQVTDMLRQAPNQPTTDSN